MENQPPDTSHIEFWIRSIVGLYNVRKIVKPFVYEQLRKQFEKMKSLQCQNCRGNIFCEQCWPKFFKTKRMDDKEVNEPWAIAQIVLDKKENSVSTPDTTDVVIEVRNTLAHSPNFTLKKQEMEIMLSKMIIFVESFKNNEKFSQEEVSQLKKLQREKLAIPQLLSNFYEAMTEIVEVVIDNSISTFVKTSGDAYGTDIAGELFEVFRAIDIKTIVESIEARSLSTSFSNSLTDTQDSEDTTTEMVTRLIKVIKSADINYNSLYGGAYFPDGRLVVTDWLNDKLLFFDKSFNKQVQYDVESNPCGVCISPDGSLIYVVHENGTLVTYSLQGGLKKLSHVKVQEYTTGEGTTRNTIITGHTGNITMHDMESIEMSSIFKKPYKTYICVSQDGSRFYHKYGDHIVCRTVSDLSEVFRYSHPQLLVLCGIACDRHGNILVAGHVELDSGDLINIIMINKDGTQARVLVDKIDGIKCPSGVCCHPQRDEFVVLAWDLSEENENAVEVYEIRNYPDSYL